MSRDDRKLTAFRLEAFRLHETAPPLVPGAANRAWMDAFTDRHAYRCLPLSIANALGWDVLCPTTIEIAWNGGPAIEDLTVRALEPMPHNVPLDHFARSNFSRGIVTLHTGYLFRTPPGWNLLASGPFNQPKTNIYPLTGIMESDWLPYPFTMNWQMTAPGTARFERGEAFCTVMPVPKHYLEDWDVAVHALSDDPVLDAEHQTFRQEREQFMRRVGEKDPEAIRQAWQRHYFVGRHPDGTKVEQHVHKVRLNEPRLRVGTRPIYAKDKPASPLAAEVMAKRGSAPTPAAPGPARFWRAGSILNSLEERQTAANVEGRKRLHDGVLARTRQTVTLSGGAASDFIFVSDFLSKAECTLLAETALKLADRQHVDDIKESYWRGRVLFFADVETVAPEAAAIMRAAQDRITERIGRFYELTAPVYADTVQLVQWRDGMFMPPHSDRANPDGSPHGMAYRDFGSIVYLNEDYGGGELYFTALDMVVKPKTGMLLAFTGGWHHEHAVLKVSGGPRLTMPAFYTFDASKKDRTLYKS